MQRALFSRSLFLSVSISLSLLCSQAAGRKGFIQPMNELEKEKREAAVQLDVQAAAQYVQKHQSTDSEKEHREIVLVAHVHQRVSF